MMEKIQKLLQNQTDNIVGKYLKNTRLIADDI